MLRSVRLLLLYALSFLHFWVEGSDSFSCLLLLSLAILLDIVVTKYNQVFFSWASFFHRSYKSLNCHCARESGIVYIPLVIHVFVLLISSGLPAVLLPALSAYTVPFLGNVNSEPTVLKTLKMSIKLTMLSTNIIHKFK